MDEQLIAFMSGSIAAGLTVAFYCCYVGYMLINLISDWIYHKLKINRKVESK